jgi:hypothetical protein
MRRLLVALVAALAVTAVVYFAAAPGPRSPALPDSGVVADALVEPQGAFFADTLVVRVEALVNRERIDPDSLGVRATFGPHSMRRGPTVRENLGDVARVTQTLRLRCLVERCLPPDVQSGGRKTVSLPPVELTFRRADRSSGSLVLALPAVDVASRLTETDATLIDDFFVVPFHASAVLDPIEYAVSPTLLVVLLLVGATLLFALAAWVVLRHGLPRREPVVAPPPPEPPAPLTPLERALDALERARADGSIADERRALELLAGELGRSGAGELAVTATGLAWSASGPIPAATVTLADDVRDVIRRRNGHPE